jgi:hypothetical protein
MCEEKGESRLVLCADTRLDYSESGANDSGIKIGRLAYGWIGMLSGDLITARGLHDWIKADMLEAGVQVDKLALHKRLLAVARKFAKSPLYQKGITEIIVAGFIGPSPVIATVYVGASDSDPARVDFFPSFKAIGSGSTIANVFMNIRGCSPHADIGRAMYIVYEAKKYSENNVGVSPQTKMLVLSPSPQPDSADAFGVLVPDDEILTNLEEMRGSFGLQPIK